jgi:hypothetical protein
MSINLKNFLKFYFGILLIGLGLFNYLESIFGSLLLILSGTLINSTIYNYLINKTKLNLNNHVRWLIIIFCLVSSTYISNYEKDKRFKEEFLKNEIKNSKSIEYAKLQLSKLSLNELNNIERLSYFGDNKLNQNFRILLYKYRNEFIKKLRIEDSLINVKKIEQLEIIKKNRLKDLEEERKWYLTKAGRLQKKHPNWSREDCKSVVKGYIWIGMDYDMVTYQRGLPNHVNTSNYGSGNEYQACWDDYNPSCFYFGENNIITGYN